MEMRMHLLDFKIFVLIINFHQIIGVSGLLKFTIERENSFGTFHRLIENVVHRINET